MNKKASICLFKKNSKGDQDGNGDKWIEFSKQDLEQNVKFYKAQTIAFRIWLEIEVSVNGKGQSFKATMNVDPKDNFEQTMIKNTHFWNRLVRGNNKFIAMITNKHDDNDIPIPPEKYNSTFETLGIYDKAVVVLYDLRAMDLSQDSEEGEAENEEMEAE